MTSVAGHECLGNDGRKAAESEEETSIGGVSAGMKQKQRENMGLFWGIRYMMGYLTSRKTDARSVGGIDVERGGKG